MNICFFNDISVLGGGELFVLNAVRLLRDRGHRLSVACPYRSALFGRCLESGTEVFGYYHPDLAPFHEPLYQFLRRVDADVLYCTVIGGFCECRVLERLVERLNLERPERPAILVLKTGLPPMSGLTPEYYGLGAGPIVRRLHVVSHDTRRAFLAWLGEPLEAIENFIRVQREGIDLARFDPSQCDRTAARAKLGFADPEQIITCLARLHPMKGQDNLLLAAREVRREFPSARFVFAGEGEDRVRLEDLARHLGLAEAVNFTGFCPEVPTLLAATDILCHPSLADGMPNAVVEAMAMQVPVIASAVGGIPEIIIDGKTGRLVPPHDVRRLADGLLQMLRDPPGARALGAAARDHVRSEFDLSENLEHLAGTLQDELARFVAAPTAAVAPAAPQQPAAVPVLFLFNAIRTGGEETEVGILARYLDRRRFHLSVLSAWAVDEQAPVLARLRDLGVPVDTRCHGFERLEEKVGYILHKIRQEAIRVVVACQDTMLAYHVFYHLQPDECRLIEHAGIAGEVHRIPKNHTARCVGVSPAITAEAARLLPNPDRARFLPSMIDPADFEGRDRRKLRDAHGFDGECIVAFVGRLDAKKRVEDLLQAAARLLPVHDRLRFVVIGGVDAYQPQTATDLFARAQFLTATGRFVFTGPHHDVPGVLSAVDVVVLPAVGEGMSHVINEAGAAGLAVVAADDGAARDQLESGAAGLLYPAGDCTALTSALERLIREPALRAELGGRLKARVFREYSAPVVVPQWEGLLQEVAAEAAPARTGPQLRLLPDDHLLPFPAEIQVETNTACNAKCIMCPYPEVSRELPPGKMGLELYERILDQCAAEGTLWRIEPFLNNEPFTDQRMVDWIALAKRRVPHALVTVTTNGSLVNPQVTDRLIHSGLDGIWFSFNGATRETYERIMGLSFDRVKRNIEYLLSVKPASLRVFTNMIETAPMRGEIADNIRHWQSLGVQSGSSPLVNRAGNVRNFDQLNYQALSPKPARVCDLLYRKMYIGYNGDVLLCCMDWRRRVVLGNAREQSLRDIWLGEKYQHYRRLHAEGRPGELELCRQCSYIHS